MILSALARAGVGWPVQIRAVLRLAVGGLASEHRGELVDHGCSNARGGLRRADVFPGGAAAWRASVRGPAAPTRLRPPPNPADAAAPSAPQQGVRVVAPAGLIGQRLDVAIRDRHAVLVLPVIRGGAACRPFEASNTYVITDGPADSQVDSHSDRLAGTHGHFGALVSQVEAIDALAGRSLELHGMQEVRGSNPLSSTFSQVKGLL